MTQLYQGLIALGTFLQPYFLLAVRIFWGWQFFTSGLGKFFKIEDISGFFETLGIPLPLFSTYAAASVEMIGGFLLLIGLGSRLVAIPLMFTMLVAMFTAHSEVAFNIFEDPVALTTQGPFTFFLIALVIFLFGPGKFSIDGLLKNTWYGSTGKKRG